MNDDRDGTIYAIRHLPTGAIYVGSTVNYPARCMDHRHSLKYQHHVNDRINDLCKATGMDSFAFEVLENGLDESDLIPRETYWLSFFDSQNMEILNMKKIVVRPPLRRPWQRKKAAGIEQ